MDFRWDIIIEYAPYLWKGTFINYWFVYRIHFIVILGLFIGLGKTIKNKVLAFPFVLYITYSEARLLLQSLIIYFGVVPAILGETNQI